MNATLSSQRQSLNVIKLNVQNWSDGANLSLQTNSVAMLLCYHCVKARSQCNAISAVAFNRTVKIQFSQIVILSLEIIRSITKFRQC